MRPDKVNRWLDIGIVTLAGLAYLLYLTGSYFLPAFGFVVVLALLVVAVIVRLYLLYRPTANPRIYLNWLAQHWPWLVVLVALLLGGVLRWQTLQAQPPLSPAAQTFTNDAVNIVRRSDWQPRDLRTPPLYLYLGAMLTELNFLQQSSAGKIASPDAVPPSALVEPLRLVNLAAGLITVLVVYATAVLVWGNSRAGASAAVLLASSWLAYSATPALLPFSVAAMLAAVSLYFAARAYQADKQSWDLMWAALVAGFASATAYGAIALIVPLVWVAVYRRARRDWWAIPAFILAFTLGCPGWLFGLNKFVAGLAAIGAAPPSAGSDYLKAALTNDLGMALLWGAAIVALFGAGRVLIGRGGWLLSFPLVYLMGLNLFGPVQIERLALIMPVVAIAAVLPLEWLSRAIEARNARAGRMVDTLSIGLVLVLVGVSVLARRYS